MLKCYEENHEEIFESFEDLLSTKRNMMSNFIETVCEISRNLPSISADSLGTKSKKKAKK